MDIREAQERTWENKIRQGFNTSDIHMEVCCAIKEIGEFLDAHWKGLPTRGEELADIAIFVMGLAGVTGHDLNTEVEAKLAKLPSRRYDRNAAGFLEKTS